MIAKMYLILAIEHSLLWAFQLRAPLLANAVYGAAYGLQILIDQCIPRNVHYRNDVIKWKRFPRYLQFVWGIPRTKSSDAEL